MDQSIRRLVTGHDDQGRSVILHDGPAPNGIEYPAGSGGRFTRMWATDRSPTSNEGSRDAGDDPIALEPAPGGSNFFIAHIPPGEKRQSVSEFTPDEIERMRESANAIGAAHTVGDATRDVSMHRTKTLDYIIVLSGEITLLLDEGEARLKAHDVVIQRGTNHTWINDGSELAILAGILLDAEALNPGSSTS